MMTNSKQSHYKIMTWAYSLPLKWVVEYGLSKMGRRIGVASKNPNGCKTGLP